jgi:hypothetical protein
MVCLTMIRCAALPPLMPAAKEKTMIMHAVYMPKKQFSLEHLDDLFRAIVSVLKFVIPILLAIITILIYFSVIPLSILAIIFTFINKYYNKRLPAHGLIISSVICWLWLFVVALFK